MSQTHAEPTAQPRPGQDGIPRWGADFAEGEVAISGGRQVHYWRHGQGDPLVHIHGAGGPLLSPSYDLLSKSYDVVALQLPGYGTSEIDPTISSARDLAKAMTEAIQALGLSNVNIIGSSLGGKVALWVAADHPELVKALVLEDPAAIRPADHNLASFTPESIPGRVYAHPERIQVEPTPPEIFARQFQLTLKLQGPNRDPDLEARMAQIQQPTLVLFGVSDGMVPPEMGREYKRIMPNCQFVLMYDAAHGPQRERPEAFSRLVDDFLQRHETFIVNRQSSLLRP